MEERVEELEQQLELAMEALESILVHLGKVNETLVSLQSAVCSSTRITTGNLPGWTPRKQEESKSKSEMFPNHPMVD